VHFVSGRRAALRSACPARRWAPLHLERPEQPTELRPKVLRYARGRRPEASLALRLREAEAALRWGRLLEEVLEWVSPLVCGVGASHLPVPRLFGAYPLEALARLEKPGQLARSSPPEVSPLEVSAAACVRAALRSVAPAAEQPQAVPA
jgi:hypothetical protein